MNALLLCAALLGAPDIQNGSVTVIVKGGTGSGVIVSTTQVITCNHVVGDEKSGMITKADGTHIPMKVIKVSADHDLALCELVGAKFHEEYAIKLDTEAVYPGTQVWHCGSWFGEMCAQSVSTGIVSKLTEGEFVQTTAYTVYGGSGGGFFDADGECIGICCKVLRFEGPFQTVPLPISYYLPAKYVDEFLKQ